MQTMSFRIHLFSITHYKKEFDTEEHIRVLADPGCDP